ncbi:MAG: hypothetical protein G8345_13985 [Magnetococcales bacterium]|nr:hypothetical protein [Magnetococcales bacterium]
MTILEDFYTLMDRLDCGLQGGRILSEAHGRQQWPDKGVYFIFDPHEPRGDGSGRPRCVRIGTHAVSRESSTSLWDRLRQHRGNMDGSGGNHRGSIFRLHTGMALISRNPDQWQMPAWGRGNNAPTDIRQAERPLEQEVSRYIGRLKVLWLNVPDRAGKESMRAYFERNSIGLLATQGTVRDTPSSDWLGLQSPRKEIRESGVWNLGFLTWPVDKDLVKMFDTQIDLTIETLKAQSSWSLAWPMR